MDGSVTVTDTLGGNVDTVSYTDPSPATFTYPYTFSGDPVGFQNSATGPDLGFYAARSYSLMRPLRTGRRLIRFRERSGTGWSGRGGWSWRLRWGRRPL